MVKELKVIMSPFIRLVIWSRRLFQWEYQSEVAQYTSRWLDHSLRIRTKGQLYGEEKPSNLNVYYTFFSLILIGHKGLIKYFSIKSFITIHYHFIPQYSYSYCSRNKTLWDVLLLESNYLWGITVTLLHVLFHTYQTLCLHFNKSFTLQIWSSYFWRRHSVPLSPFE